MAEKKTEKQVKPEAQVQQPESGRKLPLKRILIISGILLAQAAAAFLIQKSIFFPDTSAQAKSTESSLVSDGATDTADHKDGKGSAKGEAVSAAGVALLDEIIVNPAGTGGRRFLSTIVGLTLSNPKSEAEIASKMPLLRDATISLLGSKTLDQLASLSYRDTLRQELQVSVNSLLTEAPVKGIIFSTYVLQ